ncbi:MAG: hypothetical protein IJM40_02960 [Synergistaceae bacterium]|nr:hypothetical protein [Synergistaceae bacterium]
MATSSIFHSFVIEGEERVERFINALETAMNMEIPDTPAPGRLLTDSKEDREFIDKLIEKYRSKK